MHEYRCESCGFIYDPDQEINAGVFFKDTPDGYVCPACKAGKNSFKKLGKDYIKAKENFDKRKNNYLSGTR